MTWSWLKRWTLSRVNIIINAISCAYRRNILLSESFSSSDFGVLASPFALSLERPGLAYFLTRALRSIAANPVRFCQVCLLRNTVPWGDFGDVLLKERQKYLPWLHLLSSCQSTESGRESAGVVCKFDFQEDPIYILARRPTTGQTQM